jgi:AcrR family transcriptional regulator
MTFTLLQNPLNVNTINFMPKSVEKQSKTSTYHHGNLREALLHSAIEVMAEKGVSQFSLSELARNLGVTPAAAYKHFAHKDALLDELAQHGFMNLRQRFEGAAPEKTAPKTAKQAVERFERLGQAYFMFGLEEPALLALIFGKGASHFRQQAAASGERTPTFAYLARALEDLYTFNVIAQTPSAQDQWFAWSAIHGATELSIAGINGLVQPKQAAKAVTTRVIAALMPR